MPYMKPLTARIREFNKAVELWKRIIVLCGKGILRTPYILPLFFNLFKSYSIVLMLLLIAINHQ